MIIWDDEEEDKDDGVSEVMISEESSTQRDNIDVAKDTHIENPFIDSYMKSILPARDIICSKWSEYS